MNMPATITTSFQGTAQAFQSSLKGMGLLLVMAVVVIYMVLGILYESFVHPITILSGLPSAGLGALLTLMVFRDELNIYSLVGIIMLIGIVKKNAIMMIDFALDAQRREGKAAADAIYEACLIRFRPIMMTTMAALMGTLPIALGFGAGGEARRPLGLAVVGGLLVSQLLTLYITPVYFIYLDKFSTLFTRRKGPPGASRAVARAGISELIVGSFSKSPFCCTNSLVPFCLRAAVEIFACAGAERFIMIDLRTFASEGLRARFPRVLAQAKPHKPRLEDLACHAPPDRV